MWALIHQVFKPLVSFVSPLTKKVHETRSFGWNWLHICGTKPPENVLNSFFGGRILSNQHWPTRKMKKQKVSVTSAMENGLPVLLAPPKWSQFSRHFFSLQTSPCWSEMTSVSSDYPSWSDSMYLWQPLSPIIWPVGSPHWKQAKEKLNHTFQTFKLGFTGYFYRGFWLLCLWFA